MSNSVGHILLQSTVLKHQGERNSSTCIAGNTLFHAQATSQIRKSSSLALASILSSDFHGHRLTVRKSGSQAKRLVSGIVQAVLATDPTSEEARALLGRYEYQKGNIEAALHVFEVSLHLCHLVYLHLILQKLLNHAKLYSTLLNHLCQKAYLKTLVLTINYRKQMVSSSDPPQEVENKKEIIFTYDVDFQESDIKWASRWDTYLLMADDQVHWFSIVNSLMIVLFLSGMVAMIMLRTLYRDISKHNQSETQ